MQMGGCYLRLVLFTIGIFHALSQIDTVVGKNLIDSSNSKEPFPKNIGIWSIPYPTVPNSSCVLLKAAIQLQFRSKDNNNKNFERSEFYVPTDAVVYSGTCDKREQSLVLAWTSPSNLTLNTLNFNFTLQPDTKKYFISKIEFSSINMVTGVGNNTGSVSNTKGYFADNLTSASTTTQNKSYNCKNEELISGDLIIFMIDFQYEAFRPLKLNPNEFDSAEECHIKSSSLQLSMPYPKNFGIWTVNYDESDQRSCILLAGAIQLQYFAIPGDISTHQIIDVPRDADSLGDCVDDNSITLMWRTYDSIKNGLDYMLDIRFTLDESNDKNEYYINQIGFYISDFRVNWYRSLTPATGTHRHPHDKGYSSYIGTKGEFYFARVNRSYLCNKNQTIIGDLTILTMDLQYEAFRPLTLKKFEFDTPIVCKDDEATQNLHTESSNDILISNVVYPKNVGNWSANCGPSRSCILLTGAIQIQFSPKDSFDSDGNFKIIDVPQHATSSGECLDTKHCHISLYWTMVQENARHFFLDISFSITPDDQTKYFIHKIEYSSYDNTHKTVVNINSSLNQESFSVWTDGEFYTTHFNHSYLCTKEQIIKGDLIVRTTALQFEAFRPNYLKEFEFDTAEECKDPSTTTTTPGTTLKTTTPQPKPMDPFPKNLGNWSYDYESKINSSCILVSGAFQLQFLTSFNKKEILEVLDIPKNAIALGNCKNTTEGSQVLYLTWSSTQTPTLYGFIVHFTNNLTDDKQHRYYISDFGLYIYKSDSIFDPLNFTEGNDGYIFKLWTQGEFYPTALNRSFICSSRQEITGNLTVRTADLKFEAFRPLDLKKYVFDDAGICIADIVIIASTVGILIGSVSVLTVLLGICIWGYLGFRYGLFHKIRGCFRREGSEYQPLNNGI